MSDKPRSYMENLFRMIAEEAFMGILVFEIPQQKCIYMNKLAHDILEFPIENPNSDIKLSELHPQRTREEFKSFSADLIDMQGLIRDVLMQRTNGVPFVADLGIRHIEPEEPGNPKKLLLMIQDTTLQKKLQRELTTKQQEIKNAYEELLEQNKQLKELDLAKDRFMALTTHELRTPLSAVVATAEVLKMKLYDDDAQRDSFIDTVYEQGQHLMKLVNDILDFTKVQAGKMDFFISQADVREALDLQITNFEHMAQSKNMTLTFDRPEEEVICYYDDLRLSEVFANVINNAIKFSPENSEVRIEIKVTNEKVVTSIIDQGQGIPADLVDKVFNEFETIGNIKTHQKGTGLGMPISKRIMETMGGKIWLESTEGEGTTFFVEIPQAKLAEEDMYRERPDQVDDLLATV